MKKILLVFVLTVFFNCDTNSQSKINDDKETIDDFIKNVIISDRKTYQNYLDIYKGSQEDNAKIIEIVDFVILAYKESYKFEKWENYEIVPYEYIGNHPEVTSSKMFEKLSYNDSNKDNGYFVIFDNNKNGFNIFVMENNKIISFFPQLRIDNDPIEPYLLNVKQ